MWTHDSIGLGEDGPTHQPIEHLAALRAIPGLDVVRPGDANETAAAWRAVARAGRRGPVGLALTRQNLPVLEGTTRAEGVARGGYVLAEASAGDAGGGADRHRLRAAARGRGPEGPGGRGRCHPRGVDAVRGVVRRAGRRAYREQVLPPAVRARVAVEAGIAQPWYRFVGDAGEIVSIEHFGASADYQTLFREFGFTTENGRRRARRRSLADTIA